MLYNALAQALVGNSHNPQPLLNHTRLQVSPQTYQRLEPTLKTLTSTEATVRILAQSLRKVFTEAEAAEILTITAHPGWQTYHTKATELAMAHLQLMQETITTLFSSLLESEIHWQPVNQSHNQLAN